MPGIPPAAMDNLKAKVKTVIKKIRDKKSKDTEAKADDLPPNTNAPVTGPAESTPAGPSEPAPAMKSDMTAEPEVEPASAPGTAKPGEVPTSDEAVQAEQVPDSNATLPNTEGKLEASAVAPAAGSSHVA